MTTTDRVAGLNGSVGFKAPCRAATTAAITLSGEQTIDGVAIVSGDRVLVKNQSSGVDNGIYIAASGAWSRALDFNGSRDCRNGTLVYVTNGSTNGSKVWAMAATDPVTVGTTSLSFSSVLNITAASPYIQTLLDDTDAATARSTLGLGALATANSVAASTIDNGAVGTDELAAQSVTLAKVSRTGATAGLVITGNGAGSDPSWAAVVNSLATVGAASVSAATGAVTLTVSPTRAVAQATTSGTNIDFTGIPSWVKRITVVMNGVSTSGTDRMLIQIGDSGGVETTGYDSASSAIGTGAASSTSTAGFLADSGSMGAPAQTISMVISIYNISGNVWVASGTGSGGAAGSGTITTGGNKTLSDTLDRVRLTTSGGTDTFDAGSVTIFYE